MRAVLVRKTALFFALTFTHAFSIGCAMYPDLCTLGVIWLIREGFGSVDISDLGYYLFHRTFKYRRYNVILQFRYAKIDDVRNALVDSY